MRPNGTRQRLASGQPALGLFISSASPSPPKSSVAWASTGRWSISNTARTISATSADAPGGQHHRRHPFVRVASNDLTVIQRALDLGPTASSCRW
ncbi:MAG: hypothetical protein U0841_13075 [Chloroflexia bacterium]